VIVQSLEALQTTEETTVDQDTSPILGPARLFKPEQVAAILSVSRSRVYELLASGDIRSVSIGRSRRVSDLALREFILALEGNVKEPP
jgi:excisionase family DNA binding protein